MDTQAFLDRVGAYQRDGWRLAIINTTSILPTDEIEGGAFDVSWSFAKDDGASSTFASASFRARRSPASPPSSAPRSSTRTRCASSSGST